MKYLIDANIFLEAQLRQDKSGICGELLREIRDGEIEGVLTLFHADTVAVTLENYSKSHKIPGFMLSLYMYEGLEVRNMGIATRVKAMMSDGELDFDDSIAAQTIEELDLDGIVSYDDDFDDVEERKTPEEILSEGANSD